MLRGKSKKMRRDGYMLVKSATQSDGRLGFKVGKRQLRRAVDRNRIKRLVREAFRHADATDGHDWVFITHKGIETRLHDASFRRELDKMMSRARAHRQ